MSDETVIHADSIRSALERYKETLIGHAMGVTGNLEQVRDYEHEHVVPLQIR